MAEHDAATTDEAKRKGAATLALIGAALAIIGALTTWVTVNVGGFTVSVSGIDWDADAKWLIAVSAIVAVTALTELTGWQILPWIRQSLIIDAVAMGALCGYAAYNATRTVTVPTAALDPNQPISGDVFKALAQTVTVQRHMGPGLWLSIVGAGAVLVAGVTLAGGLGAVVRNAMRPARTYGPIFDPRFTKQHEPESTSDSRRMNEVPE